MGKYKCNFCGRKMIATALSYQSNQYCNHCFNERADSTQKKNLNTFEFMGEVIKLESKVMTLEYLLNEYIEISGYGMDMWSKEENDTMSKIIEILKQNKILQDENN